MRARDARSIRFCLVIDGERMLTAGIEAAVTCHVGGPQKGTIPEIVRSVHLLVTAFGAARTIAREMPGVLLVLLCSACPIPGLAQAPDPHVAQPERPTVATHA